MELLKEEKIKSTIDGLIKNFINNFEIKHNDFLKKTILKRQNCFMSVIDNEFVFYSSFARSFDSSFGFLLEKLGNKIAKLSYKTHKSIYSFILPNQLQHVYSLLNQYDNNQILPSIFHYENFNTIIPPNMHFLKKEYMCDNYFYDKNTNSHYIIELKAGGDIDNKKAKSEKLALLKRYFMLKNIIPKKHKIYIKFATAYNKFGEENDWNQNNIKKMFAQDELLIGKDYWNFVCKDQDGFDIVFNQYKKHAYYINKMIKKIKNLCI